MVALRTPAAGPLQGFVPRKEFLEVWEIPLVAFLGFPSRVFSFAALAHGCIPGPSSHALPAPPPEDNDARRPGVLRHGEVGLPFPAANPCGFFDLAVTRNFL